MRRSHPLKQGFTLAVYNRILVSRRIENLPDQRVLKHNIRSRRCQQALVVDHQPIMNSNPNAAPMQIALDGPSASGKSTVGAILAERLGCSFLDTGMMYRAVTHLAIENCTNPEESDAVRNIATKVRFSVSRDQNDTWRLIADGKDITDHLFSDEVNFNVSPVSAIPAVRRALVQQQRHIASAGPIVMAGRDIGTVVLADAPIKIYLTASAATRADRRTSDSDGNADRQLYQEVLKSIQRRDEIDSTRSDSPLRPADDAIIIATDNLTADEVVGKIFALIQSNANQTATPMVTEGQHAA